MLDDTTSKSIQQLMNSVRLENEREMINLSHTLNTSLTLIIETNSKLVISENQSINNLSDGLFNHLVTIFK